MSERVHRRMVSSVARSEREIQLARERADRRRVATWQKLSQLRTQQAELDLQWMSNVPIAAGQRRSSEICTGRRGAGKRQGPIRSPRVRRTVALGIAEATR